jgi:tetratricopeptide (TPR) repeat protein
MKKITYLAASVLSACLLAAPAAASVIVLGNSAGFGCYRSAVAKSGSDVAVQNCTDALEASVMSFDDTVATYVNRGVVKLHGGRYNEALRDFDRAIAMKPREAESYLNKGSALLRMGASADQAIPLFDEALRRNTNRPELAYFSRAIAHEVSGNLKEAYLDYRRAQEAAPRWDLPAREMARFQVRRAGGSF